MGYVPATCAGCNFEDSYDGCTEVALEFVLENEESIFVKAQWDGDCMNNFFAAFEVHMNDGRKILQDAVPQWLRFPPDGPMKSYDEVQQHFRPDERMRLHMEAGGAIADRVYCYGSTYGCADGFDGATDDIGAAMAMSARQHRMGRAAAMASLLGGDESTASSSVSPSNGPKQRFCVPEGTQVLDELTEDHLKLLRYCKTRFDK